MNDIYQKDLTRRHKQLTRQEQAILYEKIKADDMRARDTVIESCLPLVIDIAKKFRYNNKHIDLEDMIQEGNIALMKAVDRWDINKGSITTVATWYVRNALIDMITDARYTIKHAFSLSRRAAEELRKIKNVNSVDVDYISEKTGLTPKRIKNLLSISPRNSSRSSFSTREMKKQNLAWLEEEEVVQKPCMGDLIGLINENLKGEQKKIFCLWAGINAKKIGPKEIASSLGATEKYVYDNIYGAKRILTKAAKGTNNA